MGDILKEPPRYDVVETDGGNFWGCNEILQKEVPDRVANVARHDNTTTNQTEVLTEDYRRIKTLVGLSDDNIIDILNEVQLAVELQL